MSNMQVEPQPPQSSQYEHDSRNVEDYACEALIRERLGGTVVGELHVRVGEDRPEHKNPHAEHEYILL